MAGGKGTRLASITKNEVPKPMVDILGKPLLERQVEVLKKNGITDIIFVIGFLGNVIRNHFEDGSSFGIHADYVEEKYPDLDVELNYGGQPIYYYILSVE